MMTMPRFWLSHRIRGPRGAFQEGGVQVPREVVEALLAPLDNDDDA